jgi:hypothetical protein
MKRAVSCFLGLGALGAIWWSVRSQSPTTAVLPQQVEPAACESPTNFLVMAGGGAPSYNEIALEKNVLYFQRTLQTMGYAAATADIFFANGNDGQATIRYLDEQGQEQFKPPAIPNLAGASTISNLTQWLQQQGTIANRSIFFYFTGHGHRNPNDADNNALIFWGEELVTVQQLAGWLDQLPQETPVVTMMAQCYSGAFANLIYTGGDRTQPVALHTRCGFFATIKTRPSVGCTPEVNESDYEDYSSSFFAGLSGRDRTGTTVPSADYNRDGRVSYSEAHAFAKVDEATTDLPVSTVEVWLQEQALNADKDTFLTQPISDWLTVARPDQQYVINAIASQFGFDVERSFQQNWNTLSTDTQSEIEQAYVVRLGMELINVGMEQTIRATGNAEAIETLDRLIQCENGSW